MLELIINHFEIHILAFSLLIGANIGLVLSDMILEVLSRNE